MPRGEIKRRPRKDGSTAYMVRVEIDPDPATGERRRRTGTFDKLADAEKARTKWLTEVDGGAVVLPSRMTMRDLLRRWLSDEATHRVRPTTLVGYTATVENHVIPHLGQKSAQALTTADVLALRSKLVQLGKPRTSQLALLRVKQCLAWAVSVGLLPRNVADGVKPPTAKATERQPWTAEQARTFLEVAKNDHYNPLWTLLLATGLRRGEALGLRWRDVDLDRGTLTVRQSVAILGGKDGVPSRPVVQEPKSPSAKRTVQLQPPVVEALREHRKAWAAKQLAASDWQDTDLIFCTANGGVVNPNNVLRSFATLLEAANVPRIRIHDLRHTAATLMIHNNAPIGAVSKRLGHAKTSITMDIYAHVTADMEDRATSSLGTALFG